jgi:AraC-like DNA-binding protein
MVQKIRKSLRWRKLLTPYLLSFLILTLLAAGLLCLWFSLSVERQLRREIQESAQAQTQKAAVSFENNVSDLDSLSARLSNMGALTPSSFERSPLQAYRALAHFDSTLRYDDLVIVYADRPTLLSVFGTCSADLYFSHIPEAEQLIADIDRCHAATFLSTARYGIEPARAQLLYVQPLPVKSRAPRYHAVYVMNPATINNRLFSGGHESTQRCLYTAEGTLLWRSTAQPPLPESACTAVQLPLDSGRLILWEAVEIGEPLNQLGRAWKTLALFCALIISAGCALALWSARRGYRPLHQMLSDCASNDSAPAPSDIEALGRILQRYRDFLNQQDASRENLSPEYVQEMLALSLARGHVRESSYLSELGGCDLSPFEKGFSFVCLLLFDQRPGEAELASLRSAIEQSDCPGLCAAIGSEPLLLCVIRTASSDAGVQAEIGRKLMQASGRPVTCACGGAYPSLQSLPQSYREACSGLESRGALGCHTVILCSELPEPSGEIIHPTDIFIAYAQALADGNFEGARARLSELCKRVKARRFDLQSCTLISFELIFRTEDALRRLFCGSLSDDLSARTAALDREPSVPELAGRLESLLQAAQAEWICLSQQRDQEFLALCLDILRENIGNPDFSVESIAQRLGISVQSLRRRFKQLTDSTLIGKLAELRLEEAKRLLSATRLEISEITRRVGYLDTSNFSRLFKKAVGVSPSQFRNLGDAERP